MDIKMRKENGIPVMEISGEVDVYYSSKIEDEIKELIADGEKKVVIDMSGVSYIDSSGLGVLVGSFKSLRKIDGDMKITGVKGEIMNIFEITRLNTFFDMYNDVSEALSNFG